MSKPKLVVPVEVLRTMAEGWENPRWSGGYYGRTLNASIDLNERPERPVVDEPGRVEDQRRMVRVIERQIESSESNKVEAAEEWGEDSPEWRYYDGWATGCTSVLSHAKEFANRSHSGPVVDEGMVERVIEGIVADFTDYQSALYPDTIRKGLRRLVAAALAAPEQEGD